MKEWVKALYIGYHQALDLPKNLFPFPRTGHLKISLGPTQFLYSKGAHPCAALRSRVGAKGCWRHFFKNPTTQLRVDWVLTEKKCEQTPKFACFSVQRRPLHLSQAEMLPSHAVLKEGIK